MKILFELEATGGEFIWTHVLKLSEDTLKVPVHEVFAVLVVRVLTSIGSEKVTAMAVLSAIEVALSTGVVEETVGDFRSYLTRKMS